MHEIKAIYLPHFGNVWNTSGHPKCHYFGLEDGHFCQTWLFSDPKMAILVLNDPTIQSRPGGKGSSDNDKDDDGYEYCANTVCCAIKLSAVLSFPSRPEWLPLSPTAPQFPSPHLPNWTTAQLPSTTLSTSRSRLDLQLLHFLDRLPNPPPGGKF